MQMIDWNESTIQVNAIRLHYWYNGGNKQPIVMLHGITDNGLCWSRLANALFDQYSLYLPDARGHGKSEHSNENSYIEMAEDAAGLITSLQLPQPVIIGHSMGAQTAAVMAARHPMLPGKLILEDPPWRNQAGMTSEQMNEFLASQRAEILGYQRLSVDALTARKRTQSPLWDAAEFPYWSESKHQVDPDIYNLTLHETIPFSETVPAISCESLLITGDPALGAIITPEGVQEILRLNSRFQAVSIPGAGHNIRREKFSAYLDAVVAFLGV
jgi:N-formylmaleamate deformylase